MSAFFRIIFRSWLNERPSKKSAERVHAANPSRMSLESAWSSNDIIAFPAFVPHTLKSNYLSIVANVDEFRAAFLVMSRRRPRA